MSRCSTSPSESDPTLSTPPAKRVSKKSRSLCPKTNISKRMPGASGPQWHPHAVAGQYGGAYGSDVLGLFTGQGLHSCMDAARRSTGPAVTAVTTKVRPVRENTSCEICMIGCFGSCVSQKNESMWQLASRPSSQVKIRWMTDAILRKDVKEE